MKNDEKYLADTLESSEEHRLAIQLLTEIQNLSIENDLWGAKLTVLNEMVDHHVKEEEGDYFKEVRASFDADKRTKLLEQFIQIRDQLLEEYSNQKGSSKRVA